MLLIRMCLPLRLLVYICSEIDSVGKVMRARSWGLK